MTDLNQWIKIHRDASQCAMLMKKAGNSVNCDLSLSTILANLLAIAKIGFQNLFLSNIGNSYALFDRNPDR